ncbi:hypothetical protein RFI_30084 [Reticulomyxa filosa]|uniref:Uncharacterized protein n=1 Tax=Reticulomyxa filosa TaxID=46433 RepID=X6M1L6_RETFI|nr:hypothetical protein RFI_30084 [Reticulomyxa filosa]|eukprot:ETO07307.1 hypothetical protein RFI_30084 [Reticulomyxa filosa]
MKKENTIKISSCENDKNNCNYLKNNFERFYGMQLSSDEFKQDKSMDININLLLLIQNTITEKLLNLCYKKSFIFFLKNEHHKFVKLYDKRFQINVYIEHLCSFCCVMNKKKYYTFWKKTQLSSYGSKVISYSHDKNIGVIILHSFFMIKQFNYGIALFSTLIFFPFLTKSNSEEKIE